MVSDIIVQARTIKSEVRSKWTSQDRLMKKMSALRTFDSTFLSKPNRYHCLLRSVPFLLGENINLLLKKEQEQINKSEKALLKIIPKDEDQILSKRNCDNLITQESNAAKLKS